MKIINPYRFSTGPSTLVYDTFTDTDGVNLDVHTPDVDVVGSGWVLAANIVGISSNRAVAEATFSRAIIDCGQSDVVVESIISVGSTNGYYTGISGRNQDDSNGWRLLPIWNTGNTGSLNLYSFEGGSGTLRASQAIATYLPNTEYLLRLEFSGTDITGTFNGSETASFSSSLFQSETSVGIVHRVNAAGYYADSFTVTG